MFTLVLGAALTVITPYQQAAYISGRCLRWMTPETQAATERDMLRIDGDLYLLYAEGMRDEVRDPTPLAVCKAAIADVNARIISPPQRNRPRFGRGTGKR